MRVKFTARKKHPLEPWYLGDNCLGKISRYIPIFDKDEELVAISSDVEEQKDIIAGTAKVLEGCESCFNGDAVVAPSMIIISEENDTETGVRTIKEAKLTGLSWIRY